MELHKMVDGVKVPLTDSEREDFLQREMEYIRLESQRKKELVLKLRRMNYPCLEETVEALIQKERGNPELFNQIMEKRRLVDEQFPDVEEDSILIDKHLNDVSNQEAHTHEDL